MGGKTNEINHSSLNLDGISFVLFPQASKPSLNFNVSKMANSPLPFYTPEEPSLNFNVSKMANSPLPFYTPEFFAQEHNTMTRPGVKPRPSDFDPGQFFSVGKGILQKLIISVSTLPFFSI